MNESTLLEQNAISQTDASGSIKPGSPMRTIGNALVLAFIVCLGLALGAIVAFFIGLFTGWLKFDIC